jgi:hypothetical protein
MAVRNWALWSAAAVTAVASLFGGRHALSEGAPSDTAHQPTVSNAAPQTPGPAASAPAHSAIAENSATSRPTPLAHAYVASGARVTDSGKTYFQGEGVWSAIQAGAQKLVASSSGRSMSLKQAEAIIATGMFAATNGNPTSSFTRLGPGGDMNVGPLALSSKDIQTGQYAKYGIRSADDARDAHTAVMGLVGWLTSNTSPTARTDVSVVSRFNGGPGNNGPTPSDVFNYMRNAGLLSGSISAQNVSLDRGTIGG